jgi:hypothetical protein
MEALKSPAMITGVLGLDIEKSVIKSEIAYDIRLYLDL